MRFAATRSLPSYLVAFAVGPLDIVKGKGLPPSAARSRPIPIRAFTTKGLGKDAAYAAEHVGEILSRLEAYFGVEYPYEKMDVVAIPGFDMDMENAGMVTFEEGTILLDTKTAPVWQRKNFAENVAHEFAHQWFGDLVTMAWWDDVWLNESFATWMESKIADAWDPGLGIGLDEAMGVQGTIDSDSLDSVLPIRRAIPRSSDIIGYLDDTTYAKGKAVLDMFEQWLGAEVFRKGVHLYLSQRAFSNATVDDFLSAMSTAAGRDVRTAFHTFLDQPGIPFIEASPRCADGPPRLHLAQSRFLPVGSGGDVHRTWQVPICARYEAGGKVRESCMLLASAEGDLPLEGGCPSWVLPNAGGTGYYRFALPVAELTKLRTRALPQLNPPERIAIGNSLRAMLSWGMIPFSEALRVAAALADAPEVSVAPAATAVATARSGSHLRHDHRDPGSTREGGRREFAYGVVVAVGP